MTRGFGWLGDLLAAPAARWDAAWYLVIAHYGYRPGLGVYTSSRAAFFPLYPLGAADDRGARRRRRCSPACCCRWRALALALYGIHRLTTLELARAARPSLAGERVADAARLAVLLTAFAPMAFFFSAVYSESLYLALSVGLFWSARQGRWAWVGVLGALAGATRSAGVVLRAARADALPVRPARGPSAGLPRARRGARLARARGCGRATGCGATRCGSALVPAGAGPVRGLPRRSPGGDAAGAVPRPGRLEQALRGPLSWACGTALKAAFEGARQLLSFQRRHVYFPTGGDSPFVNAGHNLMLFAFLLAAVPGGRGRAAQAAARLRRLRDRGAGAAALLPGELPAADVAAALPGGAVPAVHLAGGVARASIPARRGRRLRRRLC